MKQHKKLFLMGLLLTTIISLSMVPASASSLPSSRVELTSLSSNYIVIAAYFDVYDPGTVYTITQLNAHLADYTNDDVGWGASDYADALYSIYTGAASSFKGTVVFTQVGSAHAEYSVRAVKFILINTNSQQVIDMSSDVVPTYLTSSWGSEITISLYYSYYTYWLGFYPIYHQDTKAQLTSAWRLESVGGGGNCNTSPCLTPG